MNHPGSEFQANQLFSPLAKAEALYDLIQLHRLLRASQRRLLQVVCEGVSARTIMSA